MFIVFEREQCYPKYLIEYELRKSALESSSYSSSSHNFSRTSSRSWSSSSSNTSPQAADTQQPVNQILSPVVQAMTKVALFSDVM